MTDDFDLQSARPLSNARRKQALLDAYLAAITVVLLLEIIEPRLGRLIGAQSWAQLIALRAFCLALFILSVIATSRGRLTLHEVGIAGGNIVRQILIGVVGAIAMYALWYSAALLVAVVTDGQDHSPRNILDSLRSQHRLGPELIYMAVSSAFEELSTRGILLTRLELALRSRFVAVFGSSAFFAALHYDAGIGAICTAFIVSMGLGVLFLLSRRLLSVTASHFLLNVLISLSAAE